MPTYLFSGSYDIFFNGFAKVLNEAGWTPAIPGGILAETATKTPARVDLLFVMIYEEPAPHLAKNTYKIKSSWQNLYDTDTKSAIDLKSDLHKNLSHTTIVMPTFKLAEFVWQKDAWIARPSGRGFHSGKGIKYIHDTKSWHDAVAYYNDIGVDNVICSEVIKQPLLLDGRKFHLRLYLFIHAASKKIKFAPIGGMYTAKKPYVTDNWDDKLIHDSHSSTTDLPYVFPDDFPVKEYLPILNVQLKQVEIELGKFITDFAPFKGIKDAFELFAVDVMVQAAGYMRVIEINSKIGIPTRYIEQTQSVEKLAEWTAKQFLKVYH